MKTGKAESGKRKAEAQLWIPVERELPDDEMTVLVATSTEEVFAAYHVDGTWFYAQRTAIEPERELRMPVTHWQPLPEAPMTSHQSPTCPHLRATNHQPTTEGRGERGS